MTTATRYFATASLRSRAPVQYTSCSAGKWRRSLISRRRCLVLCGPARTTPCAPQLLPPILAITSSSVPSCLLKRKFSLHHTVSRLSFDLLLGRSRAEHPDTSSSYESQRFTKHWPALVTVRGPYISYELAIFPRRTYSGTTQHICINGQRPTFDAIPALLDLMAIESSSNTIAVTRSPIRTHMFAINPRITTHKSAYTAVIIYRYSSAATNKEPFSFFCPFLDSTSKL